MRIGIPSLASGRHEFRADDPAPAYAGAAAEAGLEFAGPVSVEAVVDKMGDEVFVRVRASASVRGECARCLAPVERPVSASFEAMYLPGRELDAAGPRSHRAEAESQRVLYYQDGVVDLGGPIVEALALALPMKALCSPDCRGLCAHCGQNLNEGTCDCPRGEHRNTPFKDLLGG